MLNLIRNIRTEIDFLLTTPEAFQVHLICVATSKIKGDIAELGSYTGGSAKIICESKIPSKKIHLFDTFEGIPNTTKIDNHFITGQYSASYDHVFSYLSKYPNVYFYKGYFPKTTKLLRKRKYSFIHLDSDTYQSIKDGLTYFYPLLNHGGVILIHDYNYSDGVYKAVNEFFKNKKEIIIELPGSYCCINKM